MEQKFDSSKNLSNDQKIARHIMQSMRFEGIPIPEESVAHLTDVVCQALQDQTGTAKKVDSFKQHIEAEPVAAPFPHLSGLSIPVGKSEV